MSTKKDSVPAILFVGAPYSLLTGSAPDRLSQLYEVRVAETLETAVSYLRCIDFDLVVIEGNVSNDVASAVTAVVSSRTAIYLPEKSTETSAMVTEVRRRLESRRTGRKGHDAESGSAEQWDSRR